MHTTAFPFPLRINILFLSSLEVSAGLLLSDFMRPTYLLIFMLAIILK